MALAPILPSTAVADITIASVSNKTIFNSARVRSNMPQIDVTTYATEANGEFVGGIERLTIDLAGIMKKGGSAIAGPLIPLPQNVAVVIQYDTGCTFTLTMNFTEAEAYRPAGQIGTITGSGFSTGTFVVAWVETG
jgi:hypothetical protein